MQIILLSNHFFLSVESFCWLRMIMSGFFVSCGLLVVVVLERDADMYQHFQN